MTTDASFGHFILFLVLTAAAECHKDDDDTLIRGFTGKSLFSSFLVSHEKPVNETGIRWILLT